MKLMFKDSVRIGFILSLLVLSGCFTHPHRGREHETETPAATSPRIEELIDRLNDSSIENRIARQKLLKIGNDAVPALMRTIDIGKRKLKTRTNALRAARSLRVLRKMQIDKTLEVCESLLIKKNLSPSSRHVTALISEALACLYENFDKKKARDIFSEFVIEKPDSYLKTVREAQHWESAYYRKRIEVDVLRGLRLMVAQDDPRTKQTLIAFLDTVTLGSMEKIYFHRLAENGYSLTQETTSEPEEKVRELFTK